MFSDRLLNLARLVLDDAAQRRLRIVTAESCTGGLLSGLLVEVPGSSKVFERGFVTYSNKAKEEVLGIPGDMIADYGAVSEPVARAMAEGALEESRANMSIAITGIAGPGGGTRLKPVISRLPGKTPPSDTGWNSLMISGGMRSDSPALKQPSTCCSKALTADLRRRSSVSAVCLGSEGRHNAIDGDLEIRSGKRP